MHGNVPFLADHTIDRLCWACRMVHSTDIVEFELRSKKFSLAVRKKEALEVPEPVYMQVGICTLVLPPMLHSRSSQC